MQKPIVVRTSHPYEYTLEVDGHLGDWMPIFQSPLLTREVDQSGLDAKSSATQVEWRANCGMEQCEGEVVLHTNGDPNREKMSICGGQVVCFAKTCIFREEPLENDNEVLAPKPTPPTLSAQAEIPAT